MRFVTKFALGDELGSPKSASEARGQVGGRQAPGVSALDEQCTFFEHLQKPLCILIYPFYQYFRVNNRTILCNIVLFWLV